MNRLEQLKKDGFKERILVVLPIESFKDYIEHPQVSRLYLTDVGFFPHAKNHYRERKDEIEEYIFIYCTEGEGIIEVNGQKHLIYENEAFCIPQHTSHCYYSCESNPWSILWVHFKGDDVNFYPLGECKKVKFSSENSTNQMLFLFDLLFRVLDYNYTLGNFIYISQVLSLILAETYAKEKCASALEQDKHVTKVIRYMNKHLHENLSLEGISKEFNLSKSYLNAIFQKNTQHAPMDFYINIKMKKACKLLKTSDLYIYEVAHQLGYNDQYYFSRIFKKVVGVSPKEYKKSDYFYIMNKQDW